MTIITKINQPGNSTISTLDGRVRLETGRNRLVSTDSETSKELNVIDGQGIKTLDDGSEIARSGHLPDGSITHAVANPGHTIDDAITP